MLTVADQIAQMERILSDAGVTPDDFCRSAGINRSTWTRWKARVTTPNMATWARVQAAFTSVQANGAAQ